MAAARVEQRIPRVPTAEAGAAIAIAVLVGVVLALFPDWRVACGLIVLGAAAAVGSLKPAAFILMFLAARPVLDAWSDRQFVDGLPSANPAGVTALLLISLLVVAVATRPKFVFPRATLAFVVVLVVSGLSAFWAVYSLRGTIQMEPVSELVRLTAIAALYVLAANLFTRGAETERLVTILGLSGVVPAVLGIVQWVRGPEVVESLGIARIDSTFIGPNPFGMYLALAALLLIAAPGRLSPTVRWLSVALMLAALVGTYSRAGYAMFLLGLILLEWRRNRHVVGLIAIASVTVVLAVPSVHDRVLPAHEGSSSPATYESWQWRWDTWRTLVSKSAESPIIGFGLRTTPYVNPRRLEALGGPASGYTAHNTAVKALVEGGVVLLLAYIALFGALVAAAWRMARTRWELQRHAQVLLVLWTVAIVVGLSTADIMGQTTIVFALLAFAGALEGAFRASRRREARAP